MGHPMGPPHKRRKLSSSATQSLTSHHEALFSDAVPTPSASQPVVDLDYGPTNTATSSVSHHIEEVHLQIQQRSVVTSAQHRHVLRRRQIEQVITSIDSLGNSIITTVTAGLDADAATSFTSLASETTTSEQDSATTPGTTLSASPTNNSNSTANAGGNTNSAPGSSPSTRTSPEDGTITKSAQSRTLSAKSSAPTSLGADEYLTTVRGRIFTLTRHDEPYTSILNGNIVTVCPEEGETCRVSTHGKTDADSRTAYDSSTASDQTSGSSPTTLAAAGSSPAQGTLTSPASSSSSAAAASQSNDDSTPPAGTIAGGVVGSVAGLAIVLLAALVFLRWYRRRSQNGHQALPPRSMTPEPGQGPSGQRGMAERAGLVPLAGAVPALFRHQNRSQDQVPPSERGFTRVSGRKLPSAFSEGMSSGPSNPFMAEEHQRDLSNTSFYRDSAGSYYGDSPPEMPASPVGTAASRDPSQPMLSPGPQRRPTVHAGGPYLISPSSSLPQTPVPRNATASPPGPMTGRSDTPSTMTDNRSSRFTEEV